MRKNRSNKFKRKPIKLILLCLIIFLISFFLIKTIYINRKCKDLYFATEYYMSRGNDNKLLRVQTFKLVFMDDDLAVVEAFGLDKKSPHKETAYKGFFKKNKSNKWVLQKSTAV